MTIKRIALSIALGSVGLPSMLMLAGNAYAVSFPINLDNDDQSAETFEIYGKVRLSVDYADSDLGGTEENKSIGLTDGSVGLSSNTTIIGFRGSYAVKQQPYTLVWQVEQNFNPDTATDDTWSNRDTFLGVKTPIGLFRVGLMDTPFKRVGITNTLFVTTVGDPFAILGKSSQNGSRLDLRGSNSLYWNGEVGAVKLAVQYALDQNKVGYEQPGGEINEGNQGFIDDNDGDMFSASAAYDLGPVTLSTAYANYSEIYGGEVEAWRAAAKYTVGAARMGVIFENIDTDSEVAGGSLSRSAYGLFAQYRVLPKTTIGAQWMHADESDQAGGGDEADQFSLGLYQQVFPRLKVYTLATATRNGDNGKYRTADYAHGDKVATVAGGDPFAVSVGAEFVF